MLINQSILVTGGTGSFGKKFIKTILDQNVKRVVAYSRDEARRACENISTIIYTATLKQVPADEYDPIECIKTSILGAENVINVALQTGVSDVVALSSDKAAAPINLYGATKLCSDKPSVAANNIKRNRDLRLSVVRYGNFMVSRGSVIPFFGEKDMNK